MNFTEIVKGDNMYVKLAFSIYTIINILVIAETITDDEIVGMWDDLEDMTQRTFVFDRNTGIAKVLPKKYNKTVCWIMRYDGDRRGEFQ